MKLVKKFKKNKSGATAIEYGLIAALISIVIIVAVSFLGKNLSNTFSKVGSSLAGSSL